MNKANATKFIKIAKNGLIKHAPEFLTAFGVAGMVTTTVLAVKATPKAIELLEEKKAEEQKDKLTPVETVKTCWKTYIPAAVTGAAAIACLIGASSTNLKRNAALATAYKLSETALSEYREKVIETVGEETEKTVRDKIAKDKIDNDPVSKKEVIIVEKDNVLCYDALSGRYFKSSINTIDKAVNVLNRRIISDMCISLNELYVELDLPTTNLGSELGWNIDDGYIEIDYSSQVTDDGQPCIVMDYITGPKYNFSKFL